MTPDLGSRPTPLQRVLPLLKGLFGGVQLLLSCVFLPLLVIAALLARVTRSRRPRLVWGPRPIINNKYWSNALGRADYRSKTLMLGYYATINRRNDFDLYAQDLLGVGSGPLARLVTRLMGPFTMFLYAVFAFDIFHHPFSGGFLGETALWRMEAVLLRLAGKRVIILPYGSDAYAYSRVSDPCLRHALLMSYPQAARDEAAISRRVAYWTRHADAIVPGALVDGMGRWDALPFNSLTIDTSHWHPRQVYSGNDGRNGVVTVIHTPNHRGFKGTEFLIHAVRELQAEGLKVELLLLERLQNEEVRRIMREEADILAEQFLATAYAMSGIEGMATGLPVLANLENETYTRLFRRFSYLDECPVLSTSPETLKDHLRLLVTDPALRETLGRAGRQYVEKYHSEETACYLFEALYDRLWYGKDVDVMNLFHPLTSEFNRRTPPVPHPLVENRLPSARVRP